MSIIHHFGPRSGHRLYSRKLFYLHIEYVSQERLRTSTTLVMDLYLVKVMGSSKGGRGRGFIGGKTLDNGF